MAIRGQQLAVTATVQTAKTTDPNRHWSVVNDGASSAYLLFDPKQDTTFQGIGSALVALGGIELKAGESLVLEPPMSSFLIVCATAGTATVRLMPGFYSPVST